MILLSTFVKVVSLISIVLLAGGSGYMFLHKSDATPATAAQISVEESKANLKHSHDHDHSHHHHHDFEMKEEFEFHHVCDHENYIQNLKVEIEGDIQEAPIEATLAHEMKLRQEHKQGNWRPIRIQADYSNFNAGYAQANFIKNKLMRAAVGFLEAAYKVYPASTLRITGCGQLNVPSTYSSISGVDLVLFVHGSHDQSNWLARAGACRLDGTTARPIAGSVEFNLRYLDQVNLNDLSDHKWYNWIQTTIHEVTHVLGFSSGMYPYYVNPSTNQKLGQSNVVGYYNGRNAIILPKVVAHVQKHFGCSSATGALLENNGGGGTAGSHWERTTFGNEAMTGSDFPDSVFTVFTFSLMESTGWYLPDYQQSEPYNWGRGDGCGITAGQCQGKPFCNSSSDSCDSDYTGIAKCSNQDPLASPCYYWRVYGNTDCGEPSQFINQLAQYTGGYSGIGSRCFISTLPKAVGFQGLPSACFKSTCNSDGTLTFEVGGRGYTCSSNGQYISVRYSRYSGYVTCPDIKHFCLTTKACKNECSGVGTCRGTTCHCWHGYTGDDCSRQTEISQKQINQQQLYMPLVLVPSLLFILHY